MILFCRSWKLIYYTSLLLLSHPTFNTYTFIRITTQMRFTVTFTNFPHSSSCSCYFCHFDSFIHEKVFINCYLKLLRQFSAHFCILQLLCNYTQSNKMHIYHILRVYTRVSSLAHRSFISLLCFPPFYCLSKASGVAAITRRCQILPLIWN